MKNRTLREIYLKGRNFRERNFPEAKKSRNFGNKLSRTFEIFHEN